MNHYGTHIVRQALDDGTLVSHIEDLRRAYRSRLEVMDEALHRHFDGIAEWNRPEGGYFFWLRFDPELDTATLRKRATELETGFQPGAVFSLRGEQKNYIRLCFAHYQEDDLRDGISRLGTLFGRT